MIHHYVGLAISLWLMAVAVFLLSGCSRSVPATSSSDTTSSQTRSAETPDNPGHTLSLFDGKTLDHWEVTNFGGEGECLAQDGILRLEPGFPMTGVHSTRDHLPKTNYELSLQARQTGGIDFFCGLTFPVDDSHCTFIVGGWAGAVVGLSNIDGEDASRNETMKLMTFDENRWYQLRIRVEPERIQAWIDDQQVVDLNTTGRKIDLRNETLPCRPLGICNFESTSEFRNIQLTTWPNPQKMPESK